LEVGKQAESLAEWGGGMPQGRFERMVNFEVVVRLVLENKGFGGAFGDFFKGCAERFGDPVTFIPDPDRRSKYPDVRPPACKKSAV
jgi:hypothetical protein